MARTTGCFKGCALGCAGLFLLGLLVVGGPLIGVRSLANRAVDLRRDLEATLPDQRSFTPRLDGTIPSSRLDRFLEVRRRLMTFCPEFTDLATGVKGMDDHVAELDSKDEVTPRDLLGFLGRAGGISRDMLGAGRRVGEFSVARNETLLAQEMGLGEYTWIYVITYFSWLGHEPTGFALEEEEPPRIFRERILGNLREMIERHAVELEAAVGDPASRVGEEARVRLQSLWLEVAAIDEDPLRLPFAHGLPPGLRGSLEPLRTELESVYCAATSDLEFMRTERGGLGHDHV